MKEISASLTVENKKFALIAGRFNSLITDQLTKGAIDALTRHGAQEDDILIVKVPGAFEIPLTAKKLSDTKKFDAIICLGAVIRGSTAHFDFVASECSKGIAQVSLENTIPILFGVLTTENIEQALERAGTKAGNHGFNTAMSAIEMLGVIDEIDLINSVG